MRYRVKAERNGLMRYGPWTTKEVASDAVVFLFNFHGILARLESELQTAPVCVIDPLPIPKPDVVICPKGE